MRSRSLVAVLALVVGSCGGGDGGALPLGEPSQQDAATAVDALVARWGDELAFYAVVASLDAGYSVGQIIEHAADLAADGSIPLVPPTGPEQGLLSPLPSSEGAALPRVAAAPRRLLAGEDALSPQNQYVDFIDATLGEVYDAGRARLDSEAAFQQSMVEMTLLLGSSGYSVEQIVEAIITGSWDVTLNDALAPCFVITGNDGLVTPARVPMKFVDFLCPGVFTTGSTGPTTSTTSTTSTVAGLVPGTGALDGTYTGTVEFVFTIPGWEVVTSEVRAVVAGDDIEVSLVYEFRYDPRYLNETPSCTAVVRDSWYGLGFVVSGLLELDLAPVSREILSLTGTDCDVAYSTGTARDEVMAEFANEVPYAVFGSVSDEGMLTGEFGDFLSFTATRG